MEIRRRFISTVTFFSVASACAMENHQQPNRDMNTAYMAQYFQQAASRFPRQTPTEYRLMLHPTMNRCDRNCEYAMFYGTRMGLCDPLIPCREVEQSDLENPGTAGFCIPLDESNSMGQCKLLCFPTFCLSLFCQLVGTIIVFNVVLTIR